MDPTQTLEQVLEEQLGRDGVSRARMMGHSCLKAGSKMYACAFEGDLVVKLGPERAAELVEAGAASPFDPSGAGRPMKAWARVAPGADDALGEWLALADEAREHVLVSESRP